MGQVLQMVGADGWEQAGGVCTGGRRVQAWGLSCWGLGAAGEGGVQALAAEVQGIE